MSEDDKLIDDLIAYSIATETGKNRENGCYIATCIYGSYDCPQVWTLRRFRDNTLAENVVGRMFIKVYYQISPKMVTKFGGAMWFQRLGRKLLDLLVKRLNKRGVADLPYTDRF